MADVFQGEWRYYRLADGSPVADKVAEDGMVLESEVSVREEVVRERELAAHREDARRVFADRLSSLASNPAGQRRVDLFVAAGIVTVQQALDAGWTPPSERGG